MKFVLFRLHTQYSNDIRKRKHYRIVMKSEITSRGALGTFVKRSNNQIKNTAVVFS